MLQFFSNDLTVWEWEHCVVKLMRLLWIIIFPIMHVRLHDIFLLSSRCCVYNTQIQYSTIHHWTAELVAEWLMLPACHLWVLRSSPLAYVTRYRRGSWQSPGVLPGYSDFIPPQTTSYQEPLPLGYQLNKRLNKKPLPLTSDFWLG